MQTGSIMAGSLVIFIEEPEEISRISPKAKSTAAYDVKYIPFKFVKLKFVPLTVISVGFEQG